MRTTARAVVTRRSGLPLRCASTALYAATTAYAHLFLRVRCFHFGHSAQPGAGGLFERRACCWSVRRMLRAAYATPRQSVSVFRACAYIFLRKIWRQHLITARHAGDLEGLRARCAATWRDFLRQASAQLRRAAAARSSAAPAIYFLGDRRTLAGRLQRRSCAHCLALEQRTPRWRCALRTAAAGLARRLTLTARAWAVGCATPGRRRGRTSCHSGWRDGDSATLLLTRLEDAVAGALFVTRGWRRFDDVKSE